jgi:hypothetical protein
MQSVRSTKAYYSDTCRKKAAPGAGSEQKAESRWIVECLRWLGLVVKIWPVYPLDPSPPIFALITSVEMALDELPPSPRAS